MVRKSKLMSAIIILFIFSLACADLQPGRDIPDEADVPSGGVLFEDDFSNTESGWYRYREDDGITDYENEGYRILIKEPNYDAWTTAFLNLTDVIIEVDATKNAGPDFNDFGVICRHQDNDNFYMLVIGSDGYYAIIQVLDAEYILVQMEDMEFSPAINQGSSTNHIRVDCVGDRLSLYANGQLLVQSHNSDFSAGDVGLIAGTFDEPGVDILFDNFVVLKP